MMYTYVKLAKLTNKSINTLRDVAHKLEIKRTLIKGVTHFDKNALETLQAHFAPKTLKNSRIKIKIVESYLKHKNYKITGRSCKTNEKVVKKIIEEWEKEECITVDSSINFAENDI